MADRVPPYDKEAEEAALGSALQSNEAADMLIEIVPGEEAFYFEPHRMVYAAVSALRRENKPCDLVTLTSTLRDAGRLEQVGGAHFISYLGNSVPTASHVRHYASIVREKALLRRVIAICTNAVTSAYDGDLDCITALEAELMNLQRATPMAEAEPYRQVVSRVMDILGQRVQAQSPTTGVPTGFEELDRMTSGLQPGELAIIGARPSMGKSALARAIAENAAQKGHPVLFAALEDTPENMVQRSLAGRAQVDLWNLRQGRINDGEWRKLGYQLNRLAELPVWPLGPSGVSIHAIRRAIRKVVAAEGKLGLIVVDYIQLLTPPRRRDNRYLEIAETSQALKTIAQEYRVPMLAVAQLNRGVEARRNKRPQLSDLRESGALEQDGDLVMLLYRADYYSTKARPGITELIIAKQRNGPVGTVHLYFDRTTTRFLEIDKDAPPEGSDDDDGDDDGE